MLNKKSFNEIVIELFIRGSKLNISLVFITQFYFAVPKYITLNSTYSFIIKESFNKKRASTNCF